jgi:hypothetical protein
MTTDEKIDIVLSKFCKTGKFDFKENLTFYKQNQEYFNLMHFDYGLITKRVGNYISLTKKGFDACKVGSWTKYKKIKSRNKKIKSWIKILGAIAILTTIFANIDPIINTLQLLTDKKVQTQDSIRQETKKDSQQMVGQEIINLEDSIKPENSDSLKIR